MVSDEVIRQDVLEGLKWSGSVNPTHVGVAVRNGVVELSGHVETFAEKLEAERVALSTNGVKGVAQDILVRLPHEKNQRQRARRAGDAALGLGHAPAGR